MRNWNLLLLTAALAAGAAWAADTPTTISTVSATGDGSWEILCHVNAGGGDNAIRILNKNRPGFSIPGMRGASCSFTKPGKNALTISIESAALLCPFKSAAPDACTQTFEKGAAGSFNIKPKPSR